MAAAATAAAATYLDGKYQLTRDLRILLKAKKAERVYAQAGTKSTPLGYSTVLTASSQGR